MNTDALQLVKKWQELAPPKYPPPEFSVGDVVRFVDDDDSEWIIHGMRLKYFSFSRCYVWYYYLGNGFQGDINDVEAGNLVKLDKSQAQFHDLPTACQCHDCNGWRVDDSQDCPNCGADRIAF